MTTVQKNVAGLQAVLQAEEDLYLRLRSLLRREESELIGLDPSVLEETVEEKRAFAEEAKLLAESRVVLTSDLAGALGLERQGQRLGDMLAPLGDEAAQLPAIYSRLKALVGSTQALLDSNESFSNRSLSRVQETLRMLGRAVPEEVGYGPSAHRASSAGRGRLVRQSI